MTTNQNKIPSYTRYADKKRLGFILDNLKKDISSVGNILDVGCGNGIISIQLGSKGYNVIGIDVSEKAIKVANDSNPFPNVSFRLEDVESILSSSFGFDAIICSEVLEHLSNPSGLLDKLHNILKDDGILIVTVPNGYGPREMFVTKPMIKLSTQDNSLWRFVQRIKKLLGYSGTTIQSAAENLDHIQFFTMKKLNMLAHDSGYQIIRTKNSNFIDDVFPISILTRKLHFLQKIDSLLSDIIPKSVAGGFLMIWVKKKHSEN